MQRVICELFRMFVRKGSKRGPSYSPASRLSIAALAILCVGGLLSHSAAAQASPQTPVRRIRVKQPLPPEILAMHARAKRPAVPAPTSLELAATTALASTTFNSEQGPAPARLVPAQGAFVSRARVHRHHSPSIVFRTTAFRHQSQLGRACSIVGYRRG
jgi:hypothetical protein